MTNITIDKASLAQGLGIVSRAVSSRPTLPILSNVLMKTDQGRLRLSTTNLEVGISCWLDAQLDGEMAIALPARTLTDLVNSLDSGSDVLLHVNGDAKATMKSGGFKASLNGSDSEDFPPMPNVGQGEGICFKASALKDALRQIVYAASTDDSRPVLNGVLFEMEGSNLTLAATDGFRLTVRKLELDRQVPKASRLILPSGALKELARILPDSDEEVQLLRLSGQAAFRLPEVELFAQLIDGNFPDYKVIMPKSSKTKARLPVHALISACKQVEVIAREGSHVAQLKISPDGKGAGKVTVSSESQETGASEIVVPIEQMEGPELEIAFNVRFLRETLEVIKSKTVHFEGNTHKAPAIFKPASEEEYTCVIMPMHIG